MPPDRELRRELEELQARAMELERDLTAPHAPDFQAWHDAILDAQAEARSRVAPLNRELVARRRLLAQEESALAQAHEARRVQEEQRLPVWGLLLLPLGFWALLHIRDAMMRPGPSLQVRLFVLGFAAAFGFTALFVGRLLAWRRKARRLAHEDEGRRD